MSLSELHDLFEEQVNAMDALYRTAPPGMFTSLDAVRSAGWKIRRAVSELHTENVRLKARLEANQLTTV
jgi:hypothetical protein